MKPLTERRQSEEGYLSLSVIIPLYNKHNEIKATIESVLRQTITDFELIVVDDGSTDGSGDIVAEIKDDRLRLLKQPNQGESAARNTGVNVAKGDLLLFLDADDRWEPWFAEEILTLRGRFPQAGIYATAYRYHTNGVYSHPKYKYIEKQRECQIFENYFKAAMGSPPVWSSAVAIPKSIFSAVGVFTVGMKNGADLDMWARIALKYPVAWSPRTCSIYNLSADNRCAGSMLKEDVGFARNIDTENIQNKWVAKYLIKFRIMLAVSLARSHEYKKSITLLCKCISIRPFSIQYIRYGYHFIQSILKNT